MPVKIPNQTIPVVPAFEQRGPLYDDLKAWIARLEGWRRDTEDVLQRNWRVVESLPVADIRYSTAQMTLTTSTAGTTIPGLSFNLTIPAASALVHVVSFLDMQVSTVSVAGIGELRVTYPSLATSVQPAQVVAGRWPSVAAGDAGTIRGTFGQQWLFRTPQPGSWTFEMLGRVSTDGAASTNSFVSSAHCSLYVEAF